MIEISLAKLVCAILASLMAGGTFGFLFAAILANSKYRDMQAELLRAAQIRETR